MVGQPVCSFNMYYGSADELAEVGWAPCAPRLKYDPGYNVNWAGPDLGTPPFYCPFLWQTYFFPGKRMAWPKLAPVN